MNVYSFDGVVVVILLTICTSAYLRHVPRLKQWLFRDKQGFWGVFYKASVIGIRLHVLVALSCLLASGYTFLRLFWYEQMVQSKLKQKVALPKGVKVKKARTVKPVQTLKRGRPLCITPKKADKRRQYERDRIASKVINKEVEEIISARAGA